MKLLVLGDQESGAVINFENFTRCFRIVGKKKFISSLWDWRNQFNCVGRRQIPFGGTL